MRTDEMLTLLKENGFKLERHGTKHDVYINENGWRIGMPRHRGSSLDYRTTKRMKVQIRRASGVILRPAEGHVVNPEPPKEEVQPKEIKMNPNPHKMHQAPKYTEEQRTKMRARLKELKGVGHTLAHVADIMNKEGYRKPDGRELDKVFINNQWVAQGKLEGLYERSGKKKKTAVKLVPQPPRPTQPPLPIQPPPPPAAVAVKPEPELFAHADLVMKSYLFDPEQKLEILASMLKKKQ